MDAMKIAIAEIVQETDTFSPFVADLSDFEMYGLMYGDEILDRMRGVGPIGGLLDVGEEQPNADSIEWVPILRAFAAAGGTITKDTIEHLTNAVTQGLQEKGPFDAVYLSLHGAAASEIDDDAEGYILERVAAAAGEATPIVCPLDHHANITSRMCQHATALVGHQTQPHDTYDTGRKAAQLLFKVLHGEAKPVLRANNVPLITPQDQFLTAHGPMKEWFDLAREFEQQPKVLDVSPYPMQPWLDVSEGCWSVVVHTDDDPELAQSIADQMTDKAWELREAFWVGERVEPADAVKQAKSEPEGLIILSDTGDSVYGGAPGDSTILLRELVAQLDTSASADSKLALVPMIDPEALAQATALPVGSTAEFTVGGKVDNVFSEPLTIEAEVAATSQNVTFQMGERGECSIRETALLAIGNIRIVLMDHRSFAVNHPILYMHLGVDINDAQLVVVKTASNFQHFKRWRKKMIRVNSAGMTQSDLHRFDWKHICRPVYPFDEINDWREGVQLQR